MASWSFPVRFPDPIASKDKALDTARKIIYNPAGPNAARADEWRGRLSQALALIAMKQDVGRAK